MRLPHRTRRRLARLFRAALCALLVFGLVPGSEAVVEAAAHLAHDGHLPHGEAHERVAATEGCADSGEHGCTPLAHRCGCCASVAALPSDAPDVAIHALHPARLAYLARQDRGPPSVGVKPVLPPPIT